eukprot:9288635-Alexandrium_andersonii.AAC.1
MSASLVGSEMCIRDRARKQRDIALSGARAPGKTAPPEELSLAPEAPRFCLLYTSDAADDM